jgi:chemotaxis protein methyltransferase CheR
MNMMLRTEDNDATTEYQFTDVDFRMIADFANKEYGLFLQESKKALVYSRLSKRLRALKLNSFSEYCDLLQISAGKDETSHLLSALTTNVTHFFRERHHFEQLKTDILPPIIERARNGACVRLWSAACSAGQEAYCLANTVLDVCPDAHRLNIKILATDIDPVVLETARKGVYPKDQRDAIDPKMHRNMIEEVDPQKDSFLIRRELRDLVTFAELNLIDVWPMRRPFDVIMCRNAAIYFDKVTQATLWSRFAQALTPDGYLMIGHSERLSGDAVSQFRSIGVTAHQRVQ